MAGLCPFCVCTSSRCFRLELAEGRQRPRLHQHGWEQLCGPGGMRHSGGWGISALVFRVDRGGNLPSIQRGLVGPAATSCTGLAVLHCGDDRAQVGVARHGSPGVLHAGLTAAQQLVESRPHFPAGQSVYQRVEGRVEHGQGDKPVHLVEHGAFSWAATNIQQQQKEEGGPAHDKHPENNDHCPEQGQRALRRPAAHPAAAGGHQAVDPDVEDDDGHQQGAEHADAEGHVALGVERQHSGAGGHVAQAVPAQAGQGAEQHRHQPASCQQSEESPPARRLARTQTHHRHVPLDPDGQEAEGGCAEGHEHAPFSGQPLHRRQEVGVASRGEDVDHVGHTGQQVRQRQVPDEEVHAAVEALVPPESEQDRDVLQDNQHADEEQQGHLAGPAAARPVPLPRVVVVADDDAVHPLLQPGPHSSCPSSVQQQRAPQNWTQQREARLLNQAGSPSQSLLKDLFRDQIHLN